MCIQSTLLRIKSRNISRVRHQGIICDKRGKFALATYCPITRETILIYPDSIYRTDIYTRCYDKPIVAKKKYGPFVEVGDILRYAGKKYLITEVDDKNKMFQVTYLKNGKIKKASLTRHKNKNYLIYHKMCDNINLSDDELKVIKLIDKALYEVKINEINKS